MSMTLDQIRKLKEEKENKKSVKTIDIVPASQNEQQNPQSSLMLIKQSADKTTEVTGRIIANLSEKREILKQNVKAEIQRLTDPAIFLAEITEDLGLAEEDLNLDNFDFFS